MYELIPDELKQLPNWVCWAAIPDEERGKPRKTPIDPKTGMLAKSNDPATWADFDVALAAAPDYDGLGFMFSESPYFGVDIDGVSDELRRYREGEDNIISEFVDTLASYTELSTSGTGIHIICRGSLPPSGRRRGNVEMYESGRFFVMTGENFSEYADISECTESIKVLHEKYIGGGKTPTESPVRRVEAPASTDEILRIARNAKNGAAFSRLYAGDITGYTSHSEADMAFCNMLAFWCRCDADRMDSIFRQSGLMRDKWDRKQSGSTYGILTLQKAITECRNVYEPRAVSERAPERPIIEAATRPGAYSFDDMGNAQRIYDAYGSYLRYNYTDKRWMYYDNRKWCVDTSGEVERAAEQSIRSMDAEAALYDPEDDMGKAFAKHRKASRSNSSKRAMLEELRHKVPILPSQTDRDKLLFNTMTGIVNLEDGSLIAHDPERYMTRIAPIEYDADAKCPTWDSFLLDIFAQDTDLIRYVQKAVGYSLTGMTSEQCVFFLYGTGSNGKSTFLSTVRTIAGEYATNIQPETIMVRQTSGGANSDIARLKSARFVTTVEPNEGMRLNEGLIKQLSGEDPVTARKLYGDEFEFMPEFKLWMATNHKPIIRGTDTGIWRRVHMIPFEVQIPDEKKDRHLGGKLRRELAGIFNWALDGCRLYREEGLKMPAPVYKAVEEYRHEMDVISLFLEECCEPGGEVPAQTLYNAYKDWAHQGEQHVHSSTKFGREIAKKYEKIKGKNNYKYCGLHLTGK